MKVLSLVLASGVLALGVATAKADPAPTPATSGAQTMPSGAEPESPPPATYDPGTPGIAPGTPTSGEAASKAAAAPDTATAPEPPAPTTPATPSGATAATPPPTPPAPPPMTPQENFDLNTPTPPTTGVAEPPPPPESSKINALPPPPNGQSFVAVPIAPLPPMPGAPEGVYPGGTAYHHVGVGFLVGGGFQDFTNGRLKNATGDGGYWTARVVAGTRQYVGMEAAYVGDARSISGLGLGDSARLMSNGLEGTLRLNVPIVRGLSLFEPFGFIGVGWSHYTVSQNNSTVSDFTSADDVLTLPYGGGFEFAYRGFLADARFTYKQTYYNNLLGTTGGNLNNWGVGGQIGFEY